MLHELSPDAKFHSLLQLIDQDIAKQTQEAGCDCGGPLHKASYPRSPFGLLAFLRGLYERRLSFCCGKCRKRRTPPSVRFFGRRWFVFPVLILICALKSKITEARCQQIYKHLGVRVSLSTWKRWRRWWREIFEQTKFWLQAKGSCFPSHSIFPRALLELFSGCFDERLRYLLQFLSPLTGGILRAV